MNRRNFLRNMIGGVAAMAAVRTFPFRVYSFPSEIVTPMLDPLEIMTPTFDQLTAATLADLRATILYDNFHTDTPWMKKLSSSKWLLSPEEWKFKETVYDSDY